MILRVHVQGAADHHIGDEIWEESLAEAIRAQAEIVADDATPSIAGAAQRDALRDRVIREMTRALVTSGDSYTAPDGVRYTLLVTLSLDGDRGDGNVAAVNAAIVEEVLAFEQLPLGSGASRRARVRWSDGTVGEALAQRADLRIVLRTCGHLPSELKCQAHYAILHDACQPSPLANQPRYLAIIGTGGWIGEGTVEQLELDSA